MEGIKGVQVTQRRNPRLYTLNRARCFQSHSLHDQPSNQTINQATNLLLLGVAAKGVQMVQRRDSRLLHPEPSVLGCCNSGVHGSQRRDSRLCTLSRRMHKNTRFDGRPGDSRQREALSLAPWTAQTHCTLDSMGVRVGDSKKRNPEPFHLWKPDSIFGCSCTTRATRVPRTLAARAQRCSVTYRD